MINRVLGDFCIWNTDQLYIKGVGGYAHLDVTGATIPNLKAIWVINGNNLIIENIEFSGASVPDKNGACIRMQGTNLTIKSCYFHENLHLFKNRFCLLCKFSRIFGSKSAIRPLIWCGPWVSSKNADSPSKFESALFKHSTERDMRFIS